MRKNRHKKKEEMEEVGKGKERRKERTNDLK